MPRYAAHSVRAVVPRKPRWLKVRLPAGGKYVLLKTLIKRLELHTVCEEAFCPNISECWESGTATIMLLGDVCTRGCRFCGVKTGNPGGIVDPLEPLRVAEAVAAIRLKYVTLTSVNRDDLPDGGAGHFAEAIRAVKGLDGVLVEALIPDFGGELEALRKVVEASPNIIGHNLETVRRLTPFVRDSRAGYDLSLKVLNAVKGMCSGIFTKSSIMLGLGEREDEVLESMRDLRCCGVDILTLGQYLQPSPGHLPVREFVTPEKFEEYRRLGTEMGFLHVVSGPLVRSSYRASEYAIERLMSANVDRGRG